MGRKHEFRHKGYGYGTDILYVYCDACGSFNIGTYLGIKKLLLIIGASALWVAAVTFAIKQNTVGDAIMVGDTCLFLLLVPTPICWVVFKRYWGDTDYRCRKCRNTQIVINDRRDYPSALSKYNTWDYPPDLSVVDVPDRLTQKRYMGYWDDDY
jgi:hypothetical protein